MLLKLTMYYYIIIVIITIIIIIIIIIITTNVTQINLGVTQKCLKLVSN